MGTGGEQESVGWQAISAPMLYVRTAKQSGHLDPQMGKYRSGSDGIMGSCATCSNDSCESVYEWCNFERECCILEREIPTARAIHVNAPAGSLPTVGYSPCVALCRLLFVLKGALGLSGSRFAVSASTKEAVGTVAMTEERCARALFSKHASEGKWQAHVTLHVGDGLLFGYKQDPINQKMKKLLSEH